VLTLPESESETESDHRTQQTLTSHNNP